VCYHSDMQCECGCGELAPIATATHPKLGRVRGQSGRFINGHQSRGRPVSAETRAKISAAHVGHAAARYTPELRAAAAKRMRGRCGPNSYSWRGGTTLFASGYRGVYLPEHPRAYSNGYVYEHIVVAEQKIGRPVIKGEQVHHLDHDRLNNDPANLVVLASRSEHMRLYHRHGRPAKVRPAPTSS
jgi:hypothetical protein